MVLAILNSTREAGVCAWPLAGVLVPDNGLSGGESPRETPVAALQSRLLQPTLLHTCSQRDAPRRATSHPRSRSHPDSCAG
jgi:hypothetical protein